MEPRGDSSAEYGLARDVYVALEGRYSVWLNLRQDRYFAIEESRTNGFQELVRGWPQRLEAACRDRVGRESAIPWLLKAGLLVSLHDEPNAKAARPAAHSSLAGEIGVPAIFARPRIRWSDACNLAGASLAVSATLKWRGLAQAISRLRGRNAVPLQQAGFEAGDLSSLICAFAVLRPFFFTSREKCLLSSLVLSDFLARYRVRTECVMGVRARPFAAHCWLEHQGLVLNDTVERVGRYTPILRV